MAKTCTRCGKTKDLSEFPVDNQKKDGHGTQCKECRAAQVREHSRTKQFKNTRKNYNAKYLEQQKSAAHKFVGEMVATGVIKVPDRCDECHTPTPKEQLEAHHYKGYDRNNWLTIKWLCLTCHGKTRQRVEVSEYGDGSEEASKLPTEGGRSSTQAEDTPSREDGGGVQ